MKYGYKEIRRTTFERLRNLCIKENWYTDGSNEEYSEMLSKAAKISNLTTDDIVEIATDIYSHTDSLNITDKDEFCNVMFKIASEACYTIFEGV